MDVALRNQTELQIEVGEALLRSLIDAGATPPNITDAMTGKGGKSNPTEMKIQMDAWAKLLQPLTGQDYSATAFSQKLASGG